MNRYYALLQAGGTYRKIVVLDLPSFGEKGSYVSGLSLGAFRTNEQRRRFPHLFDMAHKEPEPWGFYLVREDEYEVKQKGFEQMCERFPQLKLKVPERGDGVTTLRWDTELFDLIRFTSIFDFYSHIGYDYKRKKYRHTNVIDQWLKEKEIERTKDRTNHQP